MDTAKISIYTDDILKNPRGQVLLITEFEGEKKSSSLFNDVDQKLNNKLSKKAKQIGFKAKKGEVFMLSGISGDFPYDAVVVFGMGKKKDTSPSHFQHALSTTLRKVASEKYHAVAFLLESVVPDVIKDLTEAGVLISEALYLSQYHFLKYKSKEDREKIGRVKELHLYLTKHQVTKLKSQINSKFQIRNSKQLIGIVGEGVERGRIMSEGVCLVRDLVNDPALYVDPKKIVETARDIARDSKGSISVKVLGKQDCQKLGMGAFLAVAQGSIHEPQFIVLEYRGERGGRSDKGGRGSACLVGKAITFDSGGLSLKPPKSQETMKLDMAGGATVLGVFSVLGKLERSGNLRSTGRLGRVYGIIPTCENMPGRHAIRPGDVVKALNGKTIEVLNTDAEGRMILADGVAYAQKYLKPDIIIDVATLTGAILVALGPDIAGLFSRDDDLRESIEAASKKVGEDLWPMPLHKKYAKFMKSDIADLRNVSKVSLGGAITAALFIGEFVKNKKWAHLDIAGVAYNERGAEGIIPKGGTGWGVRTLVRLLLNRI